MHATANPALMEHIVQIFVFCSFSNNCKWRHQCHFSELNSQSLDAHLTFAIFFEPV